MKLLLLIMMTLIFLVSCVPESKQINIKNTTINNIISYYYDKTHDVGCYELANGNGLSCIKGLSNSLSEPNWIIP